ncbi:MAG: hypothetical protein ACM3ZF_08015, partial [Mycobacterium leprae]
MSQQQPGPEEVAEALRRGQAPSEVLAEPAGGEAPPLQEPDVEPPAPPEPSVPPAVPVSAEGVTVHGVGPGLLAARDQVLRAAAADGVPAALTAKDATLWGPEATPEASVRLGWLDLPRTSAELLPRLRTLRDELRADGLDRVVLAGMGGSSLAPEVITRTAGVELVVLDSTDPHTVRAALTNLARTVVVVASKSGSTVETDSHRRAFEEAFRAAGLSEAEAARRFVAVTDPGSPLANLAEAADYRATVLADPAVGGRYSALSAFGLVPSALAGADVAALLDTAQALGPALARPDDNPGLAFGAALGGAGLAGHDKVVVADNGSGMVGFGDWAEQLLAESTGKDGKGLLPVVVEGVDAPGFAEASDVHLVALGELPPGHNGTAVAGPLGAQFLAWEYATAVAGRALGINPFDQPNVQESKDNTNRLLAGHAQGAAPPRFVDDAVEVHGTMDALADAGTLAEAVEALLAVVPPGGYLAVLAYLDRVGESRATQLRPALAARLARPVTFGWGPRYLHSTGQYHKGGPRIG